jgi:hypothetical protein
MKTETEAAPAPASPPAPDPEVVGARGALQKAGEAASEASSEQARLEAALAGWRQELAELEQTANAFDPASMAKIAPLQVRLSTGAKQMASLAAQAAQAALAVTKTKATALALLVPFVVRDKAKVQGEIVDALRPFGNPGPALPASLNWLPALNGAAILTTRLQYQPESFTLEETLALLDRAIGGNGVYQFNPR